MRLVATLIEDYKQALTTLEQVPHNSIVLFPESVPLLSRTIQQYSIKKDLFIIFNNDVTIYNKTYIAMRAIDHGNYQCTVRKFKLWHTDYEDGYSQAKPEPFVTIRGRKAGLFICYDSVVIFKEYQNLIDEQIEILMIPSNWDFNFELMERITDFALKHIPCLKCCVFSNSNTVAYIKTRTHEKRLNQTGYVELSI